MTLMLAAVPFLSHGQDWSVSTNLLDYACLGTLNAEGSGAVGRHISIHAGARVNPWTYHKGDPAKQMQNRHQSYAAGIRYWPWYIYSGWWFSGMAQYREYNRGGIFSQRTEEGDAYGLSIGAGYSLMLDEHLNLDFGFSLWGRITGKGARWFVLPNDIRISIAYIF